jgi:hypothetical protein
MLPQMYLRPTDTTNHSLPQQRDEIYMSTGMCVFIFTFIFYIVI